MPGKDGILIDHLNANEVLKKMTIPSLTSYYLLPVMQTKGAT